MKNLPFSLLILAWHSPATLHNTLSSYQNKGLLNLTDDVVIFFQEVNDQDLSIAEEFGITKILSSKSNIGIGPAIRLLVESAKYETILFVEEDFVLVESPGSIIAGGCDLIRDNVIDFYRLRHGENPGNPIYTAQFAGREMDSPEHLIEQVHFLGRGLADKFPDYIKEITSFNVRTVWGDSYYCNYSNNPFMCKKEFYLNNVASKDLGGITLEGEVRKTWRGAGHKVGYNIPGLFSHQRHDR